MQNHMSRIQIMQFLSVVCLCLLAVSSALGLAAEKSVQQAVLSAEERTSLAAILSDLKKDQPPAGQAEGIVAALRDINSRDESGRSALALAAMNHNEVFGAKLANSLIAADVNLLADAVSPNSDAHGQSALQWVMGTGQSKVVTAVLKEVRKKYGGLLLLDFMAELDKDYSQVCIRFTLICPCSSID
jgi:hypothetical protein